MRLPIANLDAMAGFSAPICSAVRSFRVRKKSKNNACNTQRWVYRRGMKVTFSIATPSGVKVLGTSNGRHVRFSAVAFKLGYAAMMLKRAVLAQCAYLAAEPAAVSVETICGIKIERVA